MKRQLIILCCLLVGFQATAQQIKQANRKLNLSYEAFQDITIGPELKLKDLGTIDKEFTTLASLGEPVKVSEQDHVAYKSWVYEYKDLRLSMTNQNGFIQVQSITFYPKSSSHFKIGNVALRSRTQLDQIATFESGDLTVDDNAVEVFVNTPQLERLSDVHFKIHLDKNRKNIKSIRIAFDTV